MRSHVFRVGRWIKTGFSGFFCNGKPAKLGEGVLYTLQTREWIYSSLIADPNLVTLNLNCFNSSNNQVINKLT